MVVRFRREVVISGSAFDVLRTACMTRPTSNRRCRYLCQVCDCDCGNTKSRASRLIRDYTQPDRCGQTRTPTSGIAIDDRCGCVRTSSVHTRLSRPAIWHSSEWTKVAGRDGRKEGSEGTDGRVTGGRGPAAEEGERKGRRVNEGQSLEVYIPPSSSECPNSPSSTLRTPSSPPSRPPKNMASDAAHTSRPSTPESQESKGTRVESGEQCAVSPDASHEKDHAIPVLADGEGESAIPEDRKVSGGSSIFASFISRSGGGVCRVGGGW